MLERAATKKMTRRQRSDIYRKAAQHVEKADHGVFSCSAICFVGGNQQSDPYAAIFRPRGDCGPCWGIEWSDQPDMWQQRNDCRVVALCFMAAMVDAGDA